MAIIKKAVGQTTGQAVKKQAPEVNWELPTNYSVPKDALGDYSMLIYGEKKIGKTTLASHFPDAIFLMFEPGGKALKIYQQPVRNWREFQKAVALLLQDNRFQTVVIDTVDIAYELCFDYKCAQLAISHPNDIQDFGSSWRAIRTEFSGQMNLLQLSGKGIVFLSHAQDVEIKRRGGGSFHKIQATVAKQALSYLEATVDCWAFYGYEGSERRLYIAGDELVGAGHRIKGRFRTKNDLGILSIPMGKSSKEAYDNLVRAFNNEQIEVGETPTRREM